MTVAVRDSPHLTGHKMVTGRPSLAVGTMGVIRVYRVTNGYRARVLVRDPDGRTRAMGGQGEEAAAERALKEAFRKSRGRSGGNAHHGETPMRGSG